MYVDNVELLYVDNVELECVDKLKILGLTVDKHLTWKHHISNLCSNLSSLTGLLWRIRNYLSDEMKILFHNSFILSRLDYCICVWGGASKSYLDKLNRVLKRVACIILNVSFNEMDSSTMFYILKWLNIFDRVDFKRSIYMYKITHDLVPQTLSESFCSQN